MSLRYNPKVPKMLHWIPSKQASDGSKWNISFFMKKWDVTCKNAVEFHCMINLRKLEAQSKIIFHLALWPEEPWEIHVVLKEFRTCRSWFSKHVRKSMNMVLNGSAMNPHGFIFDEDGAINCPMPLDALPTPVKVVLTQFSSILGRKPLQPPDFPDIFIDFGVPNHYSDQISQIFSSIFCPKPLQGPDFPGMFIDLGPQRLQGQDFPDISIDFWPQTITGTRFPETLQGPDF